MKTRGSDDRDSCLLCGRQTALTFHHLIPKKVHRRKRFRKRYGRDELNQGVKICRLCHSGVHRLFDEMKLAMQLNSLESLRQHEALRRHIKWVSKQRRQI